MKLLATFALGLLATTAVSSVAMAADLAPPSPEAAMTSDWTGGYVGVSGTYLNVEGVTDQIAEANVVFGGDFQTGMFLVGGRGELGYSHDLTFGNNDWEVTLQGRAGFVAGDNFLFYGALGAEKYIGGGALHPMAGLGVEFKTSENLGIDVEYRHFWTSGGGLQADAITGSLLWHFK